MSDSETVDFGGHTYVVGKSGAGQQMRIMRLLGGDLAKNDAYVTIATLCSAIQSIDGVPVPKSSTPEQFERVADQIGDALDAVAKAFKRVNGTPETEAEGAETAKN